ncbi:MAG: SAVED domain-containing protein [Planctomycetota bacterium]|nr:SAVED domain-containing protein [Planctomycetota bacterium]
MLWGRAAGRCQKCNLVLSWDPHTKADANLAEAAHIIGFSNDGPRPERDIPEHMINDISNLMLLCRLCHTPIVDVKEKEFTVERLRQMKRAHEDRVERVTAIGQERGSHILLYGASVGEHNPQVSYQVAAPALVPDDRYPASRTPLSLSMNSSFRDRTEEFWKIEAQHLSTMVAQQVIPRLRQGDIEHLSVFAVAPQPLLVLLGHLICDINYAARVYQLHREPPGWAWQDHPNGFAYSVERPNGARGQPALILALSAHVADERIFAKIGADAAIWRVTILQPNNDYLKSAAQLQMFRELIRPLLDEIKDRYPPGTILNAFPAAPVSICVELGRAIQPKAHMPLRLWDQNNDLGGFVKALDINMQYGDCKDPAGHFVPCNPREE